MPRPTESTNLFALECGAALTSGLPPGLSYEPDFLGPEDEAVLLPRLASLNFAPFMNQGFASKRLVASFGMALSFRSGTSWEQRPPPDWLAPLISRVAIRLGIAPAGLAHVLVTRYPPGAVISWHRDAAEFETICGVSLGSFATLRLRPASGPQGSAYASRGRTSQAERPQLSSAGAAMNAWPAARPPVLKLDLAPRSLYFMSGPAREDWEHSLLPVPAERYSITLRSLRQPAQDR